MTDGLLTKSANYHARVRREQDTLREYTEMINLLKAFSYRTTDAEYSRLSAMCNGKVPQVVIDITKRELAAINNQSHTKVLAARDRLEAACRDHEQAVANYGSQSEPALDAREKLIQMDSELAALVETQSEHPEAFDWSDDQTMYGNLRNGG